MDTLPFSAHGHWFRGNIHCHTTNSDGGLSPPEVCAAYRDAGYDFVAVTDHFSVEFGFPITDTRDLRTDSFTTLIGAELHVPRTRLGGSWHLLAVGLPLGFGRPTPGETGPDIARRAAAAGAYVAVAHPAGYDLTDDEVLSIDAAHAIEILNACAHQLNGKGDSLGYLDRLHAYTDRRWHALAVDDAHLRGNFPDFAQNWIMVRSANLDPESILDALHRGCYYSTQGPTIQHMGYDGHSISITSSPVRAVRLSGPGQASRFVVSGTDITTAVLPDVAGLGDSVLRVTLEDHQGRRAFTNPFQIRS